MQTQIAAEFVYMVKDIPADEPVKLAQSFSQVAVSIGMVQAESMESRVRSWLEMLYLDD